MTAGRAEEGRAKRDGTTGRGGDLSRGLGQIVFLRGGRRDRKPDLDACEGVNAGACDLGFGGGQGGYDTAAAEREGEGEISGI